MEEKKMDEHNYRKSIDAGLAAPLSATINVRALTLIETRAPLPPVHA